MSPGVPGLPAWIRRKKRSDLFPTRATAPKMRSWEINCISIYPRLPGRPMRVSCTRVPGPGSQTFENARQLGQPER